MRTLPKWVDTVQDNEKNPQSIYDLCFNPEGTRLMVAGGNHVLVYATSDGALIRLLKGHKDEVHAVSHAPKGDRFASGAADRTVIVWSGDKLEGLLKYSHSDSVQCLAFNPVMSHLLVSCALSDFAFWSGDQKAVQKHKINSRINACAWTEDGQFLALALNNGTVSLRDKMGEEKGKIERSGAPVWALAWGKGDSICVTDWHGTLAFYNLAGKLAAKERQLGYNALRVKYFPRGDYILISGLNKCCKLYTKEGIKLGMIGDQQKSWIWCCEADPTENFVALGCEDGTVAFYQLVFNMVHGLHKERYAYRENMTDVIIQHLITEQKVRIKCRDLIKKIAIYTDRLAVQLPERMVVYELHSKDSGDMHYRAKEKIPRKFDCSLLVVTSDHLIICQEDTLQSLFFTGEKAKAWSFPSPVRYIKNLGGPPGREGLLLGLKNGQVWQVQLDNVHPLLKLSIESGVRCLDLSHNKSKLALVSETGLLQVFEGSELRFQDHNVNSVAFNTCYDDMLAYSGTNDTLTLKILDFPGHVQKLSGFVVGLVGSKAFCLKGFRVDAVELPLSSPMYQFIEKSSYEEAYRVACLGVTSGDWEELAHAALEHLDLDVARLAFVKLQNFSYLELIQGIDAGEVVLGDVLAKKGKFKEAARLFQKAGCEAKALTMYTDLRMFDEAQEFLGNKDNAGLIRQKADWARNINEPKAAAEMYVSIGEVDQAIQIYVERRWSERLIELGRRLDKATDKASLRLVAEALRELDEKASALEIYRRLGDTTAVLRLHIEAHEWGQAFDLARSHPDLTSLVHLPYAHWLAENDQFEKAQKAFHKAGESREAFEVFRQLTSNAVAELRFEDAGFYHWIISRQCLDLNCVDEFRHNQNLAQIYYAYDTVHKYLEEPFTSYTPEALFNVSRFLLAQIASFKPPGVSLFAVTFTLAKQASKLGAFKLAAQMYDKLCSLTVPKKFEEQLEIAAVACKSRPYRDPEELLPMCYRCSSYNAALVNGCANCGQDFVFSFVSFELLPLVEFEIEAGLGDSEAVKLIEATSTEPTVTEQILHVSSDIKLVDKVVLSRQQLVELEADSVLVFEWSSPLRYRFYKNVLPELRVMSCRSCFRAFHADDFELRVLQRGSCPFCRAAPDGGGATAEESFDS